MGRLIDIDLVKAEVESLQEKYLVRQDEFKTYDEDLSIYYEGKAKMCEEFLSFLDTIEEDSEYTDEDIEFAKSIYAMIEKERQINLEDLIEIWWIQEDSDGKRMIDDKEVFIRAMKKAYELGLSKTKEQKKETRNTVDGMALITMQEPKVDLENEIKLYLAQLGFGDGEGWADGVTINDLRDIARHFFTLGKQAQEPSLPSDLDEAAEEYRRKSCNAALKPNVDGPTPEYGGSIKDAFKAGAEWMASQFEKQSNPPCWKPTDDQMRALSVVGIEGAVSHKGKALLNELYNDLEKYLFNLKMTER